MAYSARVSIVNFYFYEYYACGEKLVYIFPTPQFRVKIDPMKIITLKDFDLSSKDTKDKKKIRQFVVHCFGKDNSEDRETLYFSPTFRHLLLYKDREIVSYLRVIKRKTKFKDKEIIIGGIGDVSTLPKYRDKGYAAKLLKKAIVL